MPTDTLVASSPARSFALRVIAWSVGLFGLFRLPWIEAHVLLPATRWQAAAGAAVLGPSTLPIAATLACSGADTLAICFATILAYPATWRARGQGLACGAGAILALNTIRIGTLGRASPGWFEALHVYIWPAVLTIAIAAVVWTWMALADRPTAEAAPPGPQPPLPFVSLRFALVTAVCLLLFTLAAPWYLANPQVLATAALVARAAAFLLRAAGVAATASAGVLTTQAGAFLVTQECIATPLIPVYAAAVLVHARPWSRAAAWAAVGVPVFILLGIARLLVVAIPAGIDRPPVFMIHAFSQVLVGAGLVCALGLWRHHARIGTALRVAVALAAAVAFVALVGAPYTRAIAVFGEPALDPQGAIRFLPTFQAGLFVALWLAAFGGSGWQRFVGGAVLLAAAQIGVAAGVQLLVIHPAVVPLVRAWAIVAPVLVIAAVVNVAPARL